MLGYGSSGRLLTVAAHFGATNFSARGRATSGLRADRLVPPGYGQRTADAIPGAEMVWIEGMGHEWPEEAWPRILDAITDLVERSGA